MAKNLKNRTVSGMMWSSVHRFGTMIISFVANLILARLLTPEDFGVIGMITVFIAISTVLVDGGFASALIQKKDPTDDDYSTIFYLNLIISTLLFVIVFLCAPSIARFYEVPSLSTILRVQSIILLINSFNIIQFNQLTKQLNFKRLANINFWATFLGAAIGIYIAYAGYGTWSLVYRVLAIGVLQSLFLWFSSSWRPGLVFSKKSVKELSGFGSFILLTSIVDRIYLNIQTLIIGKVFSAADLGYVTQAKKMEEVPVQGLSSIVNQVTYPVFSQMQGDIVRFKRGVSKTLKAITFLNFPLMVFMMVAAKPIFLVLLTEKWSASIPYFQVLCFAGLIWTVNTANTNIMKSLGRSDMYFYNQVLKRVLGIGMIFLGLQYGLMGMMYAMALNAYVFFVMNAFTSSKLSGYTMFQQIKDIAPALLLAFCVGIPTFCLGLIDGIPNILMLLIQGVTFVLLYGIIAHVFKFEAYLVYKEILLTKIIRRKWKK